MNVTDLLKRIDEEASDVQSISRYLHEDVSLDLTFTTFVSKICQKIGSLIGTEETVHPDLTHFKLELASFLRELQCPFENLIAGELDQRLEHPADRKCLVEFLVSEYIAAKRVSNLKDQKNHSDLTSLHALLHCLKLGQPPNDVQVQVLFSTMIDRIHCMSAPMKAQVISEPLFGGGKLSESQWKNLTEIAQKLEAEYALRRTMLITRLSATLQSFAWSEKAKNMPTQVAESLSMSNFSKFSNISVADVLAARKDLLRINKISSKPPDTRRSENALTKIKVGRVPDRGGRASEMAAPPPEMPSWQQRSGQAHNPNAGNFSGHQRMRPDRQQHGGGPKNNSKNRGVQGAGWKKH